MPKVNCKKCNKEVNKIPSHINKDGNNFCSRSCANSYNNKTHPKRQKQGNCHSCNCAISKRRKYCDDCFNTNTDLDTIADVKYGKYHTSSAFALIRSRARTVAKNQGWNKCRKCGYNKHIEICHIKAIHTFSDETLVSVVNDVNNLLPLCPNCHWEFDNLN